MPTISGATFPGIAQIRQATLNMTHGITPSVVTFEIAPQAGFASQYGDATIFSDSQSYTLRGCKVDKNSFERNSGGEVWRLAVFDRRWKWGWGRLSGTYNLRADDGTLKTATEKSPQDLARLCLAAMNETGADVGDLPNVGRPLIEWDGAVPAQALESLCELYGCRVVLQLDGNVKLCKIGQGSQLPQGGIMENSLTIDPPEKPDKIAVLCGHDRYQVDMLIEAVAEDEDGTIKAIDSLVYKPTNGWANVDLGYFTQCTRGNGRHVERCKQQVFKWYRIIFPLNVPGFGTVNSLDEIVILDEQVDQVTEANVLVPKPASVHGCYFNRKSDNTNTDTAIKPPGTTNLFKGSFSLDTKKGIVKFSDYVFKNGDATGATLTFAGAGLRLRTAVQVKDSATRGFKRYERERTIGDNKQTPTRYVKHDEIARTFTPDYAQDYSVNSVADNTQQINQECDYYLDGLQAEYQIEAPQTMKFAGIPSVEMDGAICHVSITVGVDGCTTSVSRNDEQVNRVMPFRERRDLIRTRELLALKGNITLEQARTQLKGLIPAGSSKLFG